MYLKFKKMLQRIADIDKAAAVLNWDQEVYLPLSGAGQRARQLATMAGLRHELFTSDEMGSLLDKLNNQDGLTTDEQINVKGTKKQFDLAQKYSTAFVERMSRTTSESLNAWVSARKSEDYTLFQPLLYQIVELKREECGFLGDHDHPYDALLDQFEPGAKTSEIEAMFDETKTGLKPLLEAIANAEQVEDNFLFQKYDPDLQWDLGLDLLKQMGYDFSAGRQDRSAHPFTTSFGPKDVRVTTRVDEDNFSEMCWSCIHEGGHALYEQGLNPDEYGMPLGEYVSLGIHESQSRLWENNVGRSIAYWEGNFPQLKSIFDQNLRYVSVSDFYRGINKVEPSLIRTNADELTYHFHILIRFELEKALISGSLDTKDLKEAWNAKYQDYLGLDVPSDSKGVLQDVHWSHGSFGYFPTYSIGSFYAAQFYAQAEKDIPGLEAQIRSGEMTELLNWLRKNIHQHGRRYKASELCERITGEKLNFSHFKNYAEQKFGEIYEL